MSGVVTAITGIFSAIGNWISTSLTDLQDVFWSGEGLTFLGTLAILGLGMGVVFLLIGIIQRFLKFGA